MIIRTTKKELSKIIREEKRALLREESGRCQCGHTSMAHNNGGKCEQPKCYCPKFAERKPTPQVPALKGMSPLGLKEASEGEINALKGKEVSMRYRKKSGETKTYFGRIVKDAGLGTFYMGVLKTADDAGGLKKFLYSGVLGISKASLSEVQRRTLDEMCKESVNESSPEIECKDCGWKGDIDELAWRYGEQNSCPKCGADYKSLKDLTEEEGDDAEILNKAPGQGAKGWYESAVKEGGPGSGPSGSDEPVFSNPEEKNRYQIWMKDAGTDREKKQAHDDWVRFHPKLKGGQQKGFHSKLSKQVRKDAFKEGGPGSGQKGHTTNKPTSGAGKSFSSDTDTWFDGITGSEPEANALKKLASRPPTAQTLQDIAKVAGQSNSPHLKKMAAQAQAVLKGGYGGEFKHQYGHAGGKSSQAKEFVSMVNQALNYNNESKRSLKEGMGPVVMNLSTGKTEKYPDNLTPEQAVEQAYKKATGFDAKARKSTSGKTVSIGDFAALAKMAEAKIIKEDYRDELYRKYNIGKYKGDPFKYNQLKVALATLAMPAAMAGVMGGPSPEEAKQIVKKITGKDAPVDEGLGDSPIRGQSQTGMWPNDAVKTAIELIKKNPALDKEAVSRYLVKKFNMKHDEAKILAARIIKNHGGLKEGVDTDITKAKKTLVQRWKTKGPHENFGQDVVRKLYDKYGSYSPESKAIRAFSGWVGNYNGEDLKETPIPTSLGTRNVQQVKKCPTCMGGDAQLKLGCPTCGGTGRIPAQDKNLQEFDKSKAILDIVCKCGHTWVNHAGGVHTGTSPKECSICPCKKFSPLNDMPYGT